MPYPPMGTFLALFRHKEVSETSINPFSWWFVSHVYRFFVMVRCILSYEALALKFGKYRCPRDGRLCGGSSISSDHSAMCYWAMPRHPVGTMWSSWEKNVFGNFFELEKGRSAYIGLLGAPTKRCITSRTLYCHSSSDMSFPRPYTRRWASPFPGTG